MFLNKCYTYTVKLQELYAGTFCGTPFEMLEIIIFWSIQQVALKITSDEGRRFPVLIPPYLREMEAFKIGFLGGERCEENCLENQKDGYIGGK